MYLYVLFSLHSFTDALYEVYLESAYTLQFAIISTTP